MNGDESSHGSEECKALQADGVACAKALRWKEFVGQGPAKLWDTMSAVERGRGSPLPKDMLGQGGSRCSGSLMPPTVRTVVLSEGPQASSIRSPPGPTPQLPTWKLGVGEGHGAQQSACA